MPRIQGCSGNRGRDWATHNDGSAFQTPAFCTTTPNEGFASADLRRLATFDTVSQPYPLGRYHLPIILHAPITAKLFQDFQEPVRSDIEVRLALIPRLTRKIMKPSALKLAETKKAHLLPKESQIAPKMIEAGRSASPIPVLKMP